MAFNSENNKAQTASIKDKVKKPGKRYKKPIKYTTLVLIALCIATLTMLVYTAWTTSKPADINLNYVDFLDLLHNGHIERVEEINSRDSIKVVTDKGEEYNVAHPNYDEFRKELLESGVNFGIRKRTADEAIAAVLSSMPMVILMFILMYFLIKSVGGQTTTLFKVLKGEEIITFDDVAGMSETKEEVMFAVAQLKNKDKLKELGARPCKGIILEGPPGTGKTLLAKAIAGEAGVPFISTSGADFVEMFVGLGAARVRALWDLALINAPCVVFIDEIDAVGRRRTSGVDARALESNQTLNALLQRMDGLGVGSGVFVVGATNMVSDLDPALLRPGRFDKHLYIGPPKSKKDRDDIIRVHMKGKKFSSDPDKFDFDVASKLMIGLSGAEIEQVLNESVLISLQDERNGEVYTEDIDKAIMKLIAQGVSIKHTSESDRIISATHEAGHAVVELALGRKVSKVSIIPYSSGVGGITIEDADIKEDKQLKTRQEIHEDINILLGGREAERIILGDSSIGCSNDLEKATTLAFHMVNSFAMSEDNLVNLTALSHVGIPVFDTKDMTAKMNDILVECQKETRELLNKYREQVIAIRDRLLKEETILALSPDILGDSE